MVSEGRTGRLLARVEAAVAVAVALVEVAVAAGMGLVGAQARPQGVTVVAAAEATAEASTVVVGKRGVGPAAPGLAVTMHAIEVHLQQLCRVDERRIRDTHRRRRWRQPCPQATWSWYQLTTMTHRSRRRAANAFVEDAGCSCSLMFWVAWSVLAVGLGNRRRRPASGRVC